MTGKFENKVVGGGPANRAASACHASAFLRGRGRPIPSVVLSPARPQESWTRGGRDDRPDERAACAADMAKAAYK